MTVSNTQRFGYHVAAGNGPYVYQFQILSANEFEVYVNESLTTAYSLTGVGQEQGGTFTFYQPPVDGYQIHYRGRTSHTQQTDYDPFTGHAFTATSHESALDKLTLLLQEAFEELGRRPALAIPIRSAMRNLFFPPPVGLKLWGWNADASAITYYDPQVQQSTVVLAPPSSHKVPGESFTEVPSVSGATTLTASGVFPPGCIRLGALVRVVTTFGNSLGLTTFSVGSGAPDFQDVLWGTGLSRSGTAAPNAANRPGLWQNYVPTPIDAAGDVVLRADGDGTFDGTGLAWVTGFYEQYLDSTVLQASITPSGHRLSLENMIAVPSVAGAIELVASGLFPEDSVRLGAIIRVVTTFGNSLGLTTFSAGSGAPDYQSDLWGHGLARTATAPVGANNAGRWANYTPTPMVNAGDVILRADSGRFDANGLAWVTGFFETYTSL